MAYLHGIQIKEGEASVILSTGDTSIVALVGTASKGSNEPKLITSLQQAKTEYGEDIEGFTIPSALETLFTYASAKVIVINVLTSAKATTLLDEDGKMTRNVDKTVATHIYKTTIPVAVDYSSEILSALDKMLVVGDILNIKPNIVIVPGYSHLKAIIGRMSTVAEKLNGFALVDIIADDVQAALTARASGDFNISLPEVVLCYPQLIRYNAHEKSNNIIGLSVHTAASKVKRDNEKGYWISPSNTQLKEIIGTTTIIGSSLTESSADTNILNGQGIQTVFTKSGMRLWGNWTSAFPQDKTPVSMIAPRAVRMAIRETLIDATLNYVDNTPTTLAIDMITEDVNAFLRTLSGQGAIFKGRCSYDKELNPPTEVAQGKLTFMLAVTYQPSLELITFIEQVEYEYNN